MSRLAKPPNVGLDSQCLSYLLDAISGIVEPNDNLKEERKALIRIWFYTPGTYYLTETVIGEVAAIRAQERKELHENFIRTLFADPPVQDRIQTKCRAAELALYHSKRNDCLVVSEAEDLGLHALLTYDKNLLKRLGPQIGKVEIAEPSTYWAKLAIPLGARPVTVPHHSNPLAAEGWWKW